MDRVGIRFSPNILVQGVEDSDPIALYVELAKLLEELQVPWIELREPYKPTSSGSVPTAPVSPAMRRHYAGQIVINSDHVPRQSPAAIGRGFKGRNDGSHWLLLLRPAVTIIVEAADVRNGRRRECRPAISVQELDERCTGN